MPNEKILINSPIAEQTITSSKDICSFGYDGHCENSLGIHVSCVICDSSTLTCTTLNQWRIAGAGDAI